MNVLLCSGKKSMNIVVYDHAPGISQNCPGLSMINFGDKYFCLQIIVRLSGHWAKINVLPIIVGYRT